MNEYELLKRDDDTTFFLNRNNTDSFTIILVNIDADTGNFICDRISNKIPAKN